MTVVQAPAVPTNADGARLLELVRDGVADSVWQRDRPLAEELMRRLAETVAALFPPDRPATGSVTVEEGAQVAASVVASARSYVEQSLPELRAELDRNPAVAQMGTRDLLRRALGRRR